MRLPQGNQANNRKSQVLRTKKKSRMDVEADRRCSLQEITVCEEREMRNGVEEKSKRRMLDTGPVVKWVKEDSRVLIYGFKKCAGSIFT